MSDEEVCREGLPWVEDGRRGSPRSNLWSCLAIDERKVLLDVVNSWDEMMEPNGFAILTSPRTLEFSCSRAESATGRTLPLALANALIQLRPDLRVL
jgi:hypothetical protein